MIVLHIFSGDLWAGAEVVIFNLLTRLNQEAGPRVLALSLNEGVAPRPDPFPYYQSLDLYLNTSGTRGSR